MTVPAKRTGTERLRELAGVGATRAATALEQLAGHDLIPGEPNLRAASAPVEVGPWEAGIFVGIEGDLRGLVALLLTAPTRDTFLRSLLGAEGAAPEVVESALRELGNIVASQAISAMASELGGHLLPSIPTLATRDAEAALAALAGRLSGGRPGARFESLLVDRSAGLRMLLVFAPDAAEGEAGD